MFNPVIPDITKYNIEMRKSMIDKIFFLDKIDAQIYIDYGCGDGSTIEMMHKIFPDLVYVGFDISEEMIELAKDNCPFASFFTDWNRVLTYVDLIKQGRKTALILNSVVHEVYAHMICSEHDIHVTNAFWKERRNENFDFICVRDMYLDRTTQYSETNIDDLAKVYEMGNIDQIRQFTKKYGSLVNKNNFIHFLLKYRYVDNWERELDEDYTKVKLMNSYTWGWDDPYIVQYEEKFTLPFLQEQVHKDFGITLTDQTHVKTIYKKRNTKK